ncbi:hypothetical protein ACIGO9_21765 [Nocardia asteroides]|uniref:hypothetical protein n=1 Tax=Nocardia asteroides TaxID=1824 RepID=UPI0037C74E21
MRRHSRVELEYRNAMGTELCEPQSIRNVTIIGDPEETARLVHRLTRRAAAVTAGAEVTLPWTTDRAERTIRLAELSSHAPLATLERAIRLADGVVVVMSAAVPRAPRLEAILRVADDHQVARLCLVTGLDHPAADFDGCVGTIAHTHGAVPLTVQIPHGVGAAFAGVIDLVPMWALEPMAAEFYGDHWPIAEQHYRALVTAVTNRDATDRHPRRLPPGWMYDRVRHLTHIGDAAPVLCDAGPRNDIAPFLDAVIRYLPSPLHVCQPEHALDY